MPHTTTATELQRNYKKVVSKAKRSKQPIVVLSNNKPEGIYVDYETFKNDYRKVEKTKKAGGMNAAFGSWTEEEAEKFDKIIEDAFEKINPEDWK